MAWGFREGKRRFRVKLLAATSAAVALVAAAAPAAQSSASLIRSPPRAAAAKTQKPKDLTKPAVSGSAVAGDRLLASAGTWLNSPTSYAYQWEACTSKGKSCNAITGATQPSYTLENSQAGSTLRVAVTASNAAGNATANSSVTAVVKLGPPLEESPPSIAGEAREGVQLMAGPGTWSGTQPISYSYEWLRCSAGSCSEVGSGAAYTAVEADVGATLEVKVVGSNSQGTTAATSAATESVKGNAPSELSAPAIAEASEGRTAALSPGSWRGTGLITYTYSWRECAPSDPEAVSSTPVDCMLIPGANSPTLSIPRSVVGGYLVAEVTASDAWGQSGPVTAQARVGGLQAAVGWGLINPGAEPGWGYDLSGGDFAHSAGVARGDGYPRGSSYHVDRQEFEPQGVEGLPLSEGSAEIKELASPLEWSAALLTDGRVYSWGWGEELEPEGEEKASFITNGLGTGNAQKEVAPTPVVEARRFGEAGEDQPLKDIKEISPHGSTGLALTWGGEVYTWGHTWLGQRGDGEWGSEWGFQKAGRNSEGGFEWELVAPSGGRAPVYPRDAAGKVVLSEHEEPLSGVVQIASGKEAEFALTRTESAGKVETQLWGWGSDSEGQLGTAASKPCGVVEGAPSKVTKAKAEWEKGKGPSTYVLPTVPCSVYPVKITVPGLEGGEYVTSVAAGQTAVYAVTNTGRLFAWGSNQSGELGRPQEDLKTCGSECKEGDERVESKPLPVSLASVEAEGVLHPRVTNVYAGGKFALAKLSNGDVIGWGANEFGQLTGGEESRCFPGRSEGAGHETFNCRPEPRLIGKLAGATAISAGWNTTLAVVGGDVIGMGADTEDELLGPEPADIKGSPCLPTTPPKEEKGGPNYEKELEAWVREVARDSCSNEAVHVQGVPDGTAVAVSAGTGEGLELQHDFASLSSTSGVIRPLMTLRPGSSPEELVVEWEAPDVPSYEKLKELEGSSGELQLAPLPFSEPLSTLAAQDAGVKYEYGIRWGRDEDSQVGTQSSPEWLEKNFKTVTCEPVNVALQVNRCSYTLPQKLPLEPGKIYMVDLRLSTGQSEGSFRTEAWGNPAP